MVFKNKFNNFTGSILVLISALMFGSYGVFSKNLENYDIFYQTYIRSFIITFILIIYGVATKKFKPIEAKDIGWWIVVLLSTLFTVAPIMYAFRHLSLSTSSFLFYSSFTIFTYIFGFIFFKEKFNSIKIISLIASALGLIIIFKINFVGAAVLAVLMAVFNGLASAAEVTFSKKISDKYSNTQITTLIFLSIAITHLILSLILKEDQNLRIFTDSFITIFGFSIAAIIGMITVIAGFKYVEPSIGAIIGLMEIVFSVLFGVILFSEKLDLTTLIGGGLIIFAAILPSFLDYRKSLR